MAVGCFLLAPVFLAQEGWRELAQVSPSGLGALAFLGVGCSGLGYLFWYGALERIEASRVAALLYLEPLATLGAALLFLGEEVLPLTVLGGLIVLAGVLVVERAPAVNGRKT
jgi:drug/metabolite transporter (DMT)-like permease